MNQLDMQGRAAIVTGGEAGIGLAIARRLVDSGAGAGLIGGGAGMAIGAAAGGGLGLIIGLAGRA